MSEGGGALLLLIEDDVPTRRALVANLVGHGHRVDEAGTAADGLRAWEDRRPDLILLDLGLPDRDGLAIIRQVRREAATPILVLSARGDEHDRVTALEQGADDYLTKPFGLAELRARIAALLRRAAGPRADAGGLLTVGQVSLDVARREVRVGERLVELTPREYELLKVLLGRAGSVVTRSRLLRAVWGAAYSDESHYLHVYVSRLRRKLAAAGAAELIVAEPGVGYRVLLPAD
ncbi:MAG TPA: response regulator transcription factor [Candidatus Limnocylindrales bacterium]|nr:response regulator transcription factor [Candidatus Limnocylindrales bacterium]